MQLPYPEDLGRQMFKPPQIGRYLAKRDLHVVYQDSELVVIEPERWVATLLDQGPGAIEPQEPPGPALMLQV